MQVLSEPYFQKIILLGFSDYKSNHYEKLREHLLILIKSKFGHKIISHEFKHIALSAEYYIYKCESCKKEMQLYIDCDEDNIVALGDCSKAACSV